MKDARNKYHFKDAGAEMTAEPVGAAIRSDISTLGYNVDNWPGMPIVGPNDTDDLNARINQAEQEIEADRGFSWDQVMMEAQSIVNRYETTVY